MYHLNLMLQDVNSFTKIIKMCIDIEVHNFYSQIDLICSFNKVVQ